MEKTFNFNGTTYTVSTCTAIALCDLETGDRQNALLVENTDEYGETFRFVVFGWKMDNLNTVEDFADMCEDSSAWESDWECLDTVEM